MSLKVGGLGFILFCYFLAVSTNVIHENLSPKVVQTEKWLNLTLHCNANEVPGATVVWRREGSRNITLRSGKIFELVEEEFSTIEGDPLNLTLIQSGDKGVYICTASNGVDSSVRKRFIVYVVFPPEIKIPTPYWQEHAMLGENATFQCLVEAQPRGTNNWILNTGKYNVPDIILENNNKYVIEETELNEDTTLMQLTISNIEPGDYLVYGCESDNRYGGIKIERRLSNDSIEHLS